MKPTYKNLEKRIKYLEAQMLSVVWRGVHLWGEKFAVDYNQHLIREEINSKAHSIKASKEAKP